MKNIVAALDDNASSAIVADTGYMIAKAMNAELTLLHVITEPHYYSMEEFNPFIGMKQPILRRSNRILINKTRS
jgi:hypothetical protein